MGYPDESIAKFCQDDRGAGPRDAEEARTSCPTYKMVDTCAAEFEAATPYFYSTYETRVRGPALRPARRSSSSAPDRSASARASSSTTAASTASWPARRRTSTPSSSTTIRRRSPPTTTSPTASTSSRSPWRTWSTSSRRRTPTASIVQFGGQTSVNLAVPLEEALKGKKAKILGTSPDMIDMAEDRKRWTALMSELDIKQPESGTGLSFDEVKVACQPHRLPGAAPPVLRAGRTGHGDHLQRGGAEDLRRDGGQGLQDAPGPHRQVPLARHRDRRRRRRATARTSSSAGSWSTSRRRACTPATRPWCCPSRPSRPTIMDRIIEITTEVAMALQIKGLMNLQLAVKDERGLHDRGEPPGVEDRAVRLQGHRRSAGEDRHQGHARARR